MVDVHPVGFDGKEPGRVNDVPTWRADQVPYGGVNDSGNTKEGPACTVAEMTERRLVVLQP